MILRFLPLLSMISCASGDFGSSLALFLEDASSQSIESWKQIAMFVMIYLIVTLILFVNTFCICRINRQPKQAKVEPVLKTVVINVHHDKEPRVVNLSLRQTLPSERRSSRVESSDAATLHPQHSDYRIISTKTARLKDSLRNAKTARDGLSHSEKAMVREIASATARSIRELSKKSKRSSKKSSEKTSSSDSISSSSSSSSSSTTPSDRSSKSRRTSSSSRYSSDRSSHSGSRSSRSDTSHRLSSSRSSSNRSSRSRK